MTDRRARALAALAIASSILASLLALYALAVKLVRYEGFALSGHIGLLSYDLKVLGAEARSPPLDSVKTISLAVAAMAVLALGSAAAGLYSLRRRGGELEALELSASSALASSLLLALLYSIFRLIVRDVLPALPALGSFATAAGLLRLERPAVEKSFVLVVYERAGFILILWAVLSLALAFALTRALWRRIGERPEEPSL